MKSGFIVMGIVTLIGLLTLSSYGIRYCNRVATVTSEEFDPRTMLKRYEWFKDASAQCEKKLADVKIYEGRLKNLNEGYVGKSRNEWNRQDREQYNLWISESSGVQASYNALAAEYNANMAKINFRFTNVGDLPSGATEPLPREFKPYLN